MGDYGPSRIVVAWACDRDGRYSCGDDVGVALRRLDYSLIHRRRDRGRVPTTRVLESTLASRRAGFATVMTLMG